MKPEACSHSAGFAKDLRMKMSEMLRYSAKLILPSNNSQTGWFAEGLAAHNIIALNPSHRVARIHYQGCLLSDPGVIVIRMIGDDQHTVVFGDILHGDAFHLQIVMAPSADTRKIGIVVADFGAILLQQLNNSQG